MNADPGNRRIAKIFQNGRSQAVRLPAEFRFEGTEVEIRRDLVTGDVILSQIPRRTGSWDAFLAAVAELKTGDVPERFFERDQGVHDRDDPFA